MGMNTHEIISNSSATIVDQETADNTAGSSFKVPARHVTFQAVANGTSGAYAADIDVEVSNDGVNWVVLGNISISGTATTAATDGFSASLAWSYVRGKTGTITGTGAYLKR